MTYPQQSDIEEHKSLLWTRLLQYFGGHVPFESVIQELRKLMGDSALWVHNNHTKLNMEEVKQQIQSLSLSPQLKMTIKNKDPDKTFTTYFNSKEDLINYKNFIETLIKNVKKKTLEETK